MFHQMAIKSKISAYVGLKQ